MLIITVRQRFQFFFKKNQFTYFLVITNKQHLILNINLNYNNIYATNLNSNIYKKKYSISVIEPCLSYPSATYNGDQIHTLHTL